MSLKDRKSSVELRQEKGVKAIADVDEARWRVRHVVRKKENDWLKKLMLFNVVGTRPSDWPGEDDDDDD